MFFLYDPLMLLHHLLVSEIMIIHDDYPLYYCWDVFFESKSSFFLSTKYLLYYCLAPRGITAARPPFFGMPVLHSVAGHLSRASLELLSPLDWLLGSLEALLEPPGALLGASWRLLGRSWGGSWGLLGASWVVLEAIHKNTNKNISTKHRFASQRR